MKYNLWLDRPGKHLLNVILQIFRNNIYIYIYIYTVLLGTLGTLY